MTHLNLGAGQNLMADTVEVMRELYRVCKKGAFIVITVPGWHHDDQINDPTHVRAITPEMMALFSKTACAKFKEMGASNTPLAVMFNVDFTLEAINYVLDPEFQHWANDPGLQKLIRTNRNVIKEVKMTLMVKKEPA